jgi:hypothetical protein
MKNIFDQSKQFNFLTCNITCITCNIISFCEQRVHFIKFKYQKEDEKFQFINYLGWKFIGVKKN